MLRGRFYDERVQDFGPGPALDGRSRKQGGGWNAQGSLSIFSSADSDEGTAFVEKDLTWLNRIGLTKSRVIATLVVAGKVYISGSIAALVSARCCMRH